MPAEITSTPADPTSINGALADYLRQEGRQIIQEWSDRVSHDPALPTDELSSTALLDHLPFLFNDLVESLRHYRDPAAAANSSEDAVAHGATRWSQGFAPPQIMREIAHLRSVLIYHLRVFDALHPEFGLTERVFTSTTVHRFLDDVAIASLEACVG